MLFVLVKCALSTIFVCLLSELSTIFVCLLFIVVLSVVDKQTSCLLSSVWSVVKTFKGPLFLIYSFHNQNGFIYSW